MGIKSRDWNEIGDYISKIKSEGLSYKEGAKRFGLKLSDIYEYNKRFKNKEKSCTEVGSPVSPLNESKSGNESSPSLEGEKSSVANSRFKVNAGNGDKVGNVDLPAGVADLIINYRQEHPLHGYKRIEDYLKNRYFVVVPRKKIRELLKLHGLTADNDSSFDQSRLSSSKADKGTRRFEAAYPRELYQMDITYVYLVNQTICYLVVVLDDNSRFCVSCELRRDYRTISMIEVLHRGIERYGKACKLLTDQGSSFYSWSREQTLFSRYLDDMKIEHIVADPHSPQTLGKVERFNQTIQRELLDKSHFLSYEEARQGIESYMHQYNYDRPHQGIDGKCPASRFQGIIGETSRMVLLFQMVMFFLPPTAAVRVRLNFVVYLPSKKNAIPVFLFVK